MIEEVTHLKSFLMVFVSLILVGFSARNTWAQDMPRIVRVGAYNNLPKIYQVPGGGAEGVFADILEYIAEKENWELHYVFGTFEEGLENLKRGEVDIMVDVAFSQERMQQYDFTNEAVLGSWAVIYTHRGLKVDSFMDLDDKKIAILKSSVYLEDAEGINKYIRAFNLHVVFVKVDEYNQIFSMLNRGDVDAAVVSRIYGALNQKNYENIKATDIFFSPTELRFALKKGAPNNSYLIERIDYWVGQLKAGHNEVYEEILGKHGLLNPAQERASRSRWLWVTVGAGIVFLILYGLIVIQLKFLKRRVSQKKTRR